MSDQTMQTPRITKVTVNIGVGEGGQRLQLAERVLGSLTGRTPTRTLSRTHNRDLKLRKGAPIGCKVTMRDPELVQRFLKDALWVRENTLPGYCFDTSGNLSFGVRDHTDFPEQKYDPETGVFGMDVNVVLERPGHRVSRRRQRSARVGRKHRVDQVEAKAWFTENFGVTIKEE